MSSAPAMPSGVALPRQGAPDAPARTCGAAGTDPGAGSCDPAPVHELRAAQVYDALSTSQSGLTPAEAQARLGRYGPNAIHDVRDRRLLRRFAANFTHLMAILLWVGGLVAFVAQLPQLGIAIWAVNVINGIFAFWQEYRAERATQALRRLLPSYVRVRRGEETRVLAEEVVPGDVLLLSAGDRVPADGRLVAASELRLDQSTLTGESQPVRKTADRWLAAGLSRLELPNMVYAGTSLAAGSGVAVVTATGMDTEFGRVARLTQGVGDALSPLQREMANVTRVVTALVLGVGAVFFVLAMAFARIGLAPGVIFALGMVMAFVPEGLLPTMTLSLAMGVQRMAKRHALVKRLSAVETLGCTTVICTDKTGTLTENEMTVRSLWLPDRPLTATGVGYAPEGALLDEQGVPAAGSDGVRQLLVAGALCNNARLLPPNGESPHWSALGDPTEAALRVVALKAGLDLEAAARAWPRVRELPFDSRRKRMATIHGTPAARGERVAFVKGAPAETLALCRRVWLDGGERALDGALRSRALAANDAYARGGLRVLAVAQRVLPDALSDYEPDGVEQGLTFLGLVAMMDPPRPEVAHAVQQCHQAGIRIVMLTGDYGLTAESIARRVGIVQGPPARIVTGAELEAMPDADLAATLAEQRQQVIFARVAPEHKLRVVAALQAAGHVVAVTGDGVNDAPALKKADIGVAMGVAGTDVAKEAADMILTDDNFASIVSAVEEGRAVYANIKKFITYIFSSNTAEAFPFVCFALSRTRIPLALTVMQILSIDLGANIVPGLALGAEPPETGVMSQPPRRRGDHLLDAPVLRRALLWLGPAQGVAAIAAFYFQYWAHGYAGRWLDLPSAGTLYASATAMALASVVVTHIGNLFSLRTDRASIVHTPLFSNPLVWLGVASELLLVALVVYTPALEWLFGTAPFGVANWPFLFAWTPLPILSDEIRKVLVRRRAAVHCPARAEGSGDAGGRP